MKKLSGLLFILSTFIFSNLTYAATITCYGAQSANNCTKCSACNSDCMVTIGCGAWDGPCGCSSSNGNSLSVAPRPIKEKLNIYKSNIKPGQQLDNKLQE